MTPPDPHDYPSREQITDDITQMSQQMRQDDPGPQTIEERGRPLSDIDILPLHWLWPGRILRGKLTILEGDSGLGKSLFTLDLASRITTGRPLPDGSAGVKGQVILIAPEDAAFDVIKPRIQAAGGDPSQVRLLSYVRTPSAIPGRPFSSVFSLPAHLRILAATLKETRAHLIIIDPLTAVLASSIKGPTDQDIRPGLFPLALLAQNTGCAILIVHHHPQGSFGNPLLYRSSDTLSTLAGSRTGLLIVEHPSDQNTCILATTKNKFSAKASNLTYQIVGNAEGIPSIRWLGTNHTPTTSLLKGSPHHLHYSFKRQALLKALQASGTPLSPKDLSRQTGQDHTLVKQMLRRMLNAGEILSPCYGLYTSHDRPLTQKQFSENHTVLPATSTTLATPATLNHLDSNFENTPLTPTTPTTPTTPATVNYLDSNFTPPLVFPSFTRYSRAM